jgi:integrase
MNEPQQAPLKRTYTPIPGYEHYEHRTPLELLYEDWLAPRKNTTKESTHGAYEDQMLPFFDHFKRRELRTFTHEDVVTVMNRMLKKGLTGQVIVQKLQMFRRVLQWGVDTGKIDRMPLKWRLLPRIQCGKSEKLPFTYAEHQKVLEECAKERYHKFWAPACRIAWHTGLRMGDVAQIDINVVNFNAGVVYLGSMKKSTTREKLEIPIEPDLLPLLMELAKTAKERETPFLLHQMCTYYREQRSVLINVFREICDAVGFRGSFHSYRHAFVTRLLNAGVDPITISSMTGQTLQIIQGYSHVSVNAKAVALAKSRVAMGLTAEKPTIIEVE